VCYSIPNSYNVYILLLIHGAESFLEANWFCS